EVTGVPLRRVGLPAQRGSDRPDPSEWPAAVALDLVEQGVEPVTVAAQQVLRDRRRHLGERLVLGGLGAMSPPAGIIGHDAPSPGCVGDAPLDGSGWKRRSCGFGGGPLSARGPLLLALVSHWTGGRDRPRPLWLRRSAVGGGTSC